MEENKIVKHIRAERVDIVEADGTMKMSLFNSTNIPPALMDGEDILPGHRQGDGRSGILFFNTEGDECGGLIFGSHKGPDGSYHAGMSLTFDQYKNDQVIQLLYEENNDGSSYGFLVTDKGSASIKETVALVNAMNETEDPEEKERIMAELMTHSVLRMRVGKLRDDSVGVNLYDKNGKPRIRICVDADDNPRFEILDAEGNVKAVEI